MDKETLKKILKDKKLFFTKHFLQRAEIRSIDPEYIKTLLQTLEKLEYVIVQESSESEIKLELIFAKSRKYDLRVIISIKERQKQINIITAHIQNKKKRKRLEKWLRKSR